MVESRYTENNSVKPDIALAKNADSIVSTIEKIKNFSFSRALKFEFAEFFRDMAHLYYLMAILALLYVHRSQLCLWKIFQAIGLGELIRKSILSISKTLAYLLWLPAFITQWLLIFLVQATTIIFGLTLFSASFSLLYINYAFIQEFFTVEGFGAVLWLLIKYSFTNFLWGIVVFGAFGPFVEYVIPEVHNKALKNRYEIYAKAAPVVLSLIIVSIVGLTGFGMKPSWNYLKEGFDRLYPYQTRQGAVYSSINSISVFTFTPTIVLGAGAWRVLTFPKESKIPSLEKKNSL